MASSSARLIRKVVGTLANAVSPVAAHSIAKQQ
jgi:hypothetical protein